MRRQESAHDAQCAFRDIHGLVFDEFSLNSVAHLGYDLPRTEVPQAYGRVKGSKRKTKLYWFLPFHLKSYLNRNKKSARLEFKTFNHCDRHQDCDQTGGGIAERVLATTV
jgi:hypothetical protein